MVLCDFADTKVVGGEGENFKLVPNQHPHADQIGYGSPGPYHRQHSPLPDWNAHIVVFKFGVAL